jgi:hypothetical protein
MAYNLSFGRAFTLQVDYHQLDTKPYDPTIFNLGPNWDCNLLTFIQADGNVVHNYELESIFDSTTGQFVTNEVEVTTGGIQTSEYCPDGGEEDFFYSTNGDNITINERTHTQIGFCISNQITSVVSYDSLLYTNSIDYFCSNTLTYANGSVATFGYVVTTSIYAEQKLAFISSATDPQGHQMRYSYTNSNGAILLTQVVDFDGNTNLFLYGNSAYPASITEITNTAYGLAVHFAYDTNGFLTNTTDVMGMSSSYQYTDIADLFFTSYDTNGRPFNGYDTDTNGNQIYLPPDTNYVWLLTGMTTPYGTTSFDYFHPTWPMFTSDLVFAGITPTNTDIISSAFNNINRAITVTTPDTGKSLYLYQDRIPSGYFGSYPVYNGDDPNVGAQYDEFYSGFAWDEFWDDNSFYWGPRQYANLSTTVLTNLASADFRNARDRNWLGHQDPAPYVDSVSQSLNFEQEVSPDDMNTGPNILYGYIGVQLGSSDHSTNDALPIGIGYQTSVAGTFYIENTTRNDLGYPTMVVDLGTDENGISIMKTNWYNYAANEIDLLQHLGPDGTMREGYNYDNGHQVLTMTNALGEVTHYTYNTA